MQLSKIFSVIIALTLGVQAAPAAPAPAQDVETRDAPLKDEDWKFGVNCKRDGLKDENWRFCVQSKMRRTDVEARDAPLKDEDWKFGVNCKRDGLKDENWRFCVQSK